jgi:protein-S-isoprenylcysteine O-methyltransferase Ste14
LQSIGLLVRSVLFSESLTLISSFHIFFTSISRPVHVLVRIFPHIILATVSKTKTEENFMTKTIHSKKTIEISAWMAYSIILFEMLYMSTPFAVFFYSVYKSPLKWLTESEKTAWLVHAIMPHFSESGSVLVNGLLLASWPLMIAGLIVFMVGFFQIYYAKFKGKGAVTGGIYTYIRHPQYAAWSIFGLGMCLFWSRMIVWIAYVMMIFIYMYLAHAEEQECLAKFGDSYREYLGKTGGFFPKIGRAHV